MKRQEQRRSQRYTDFLPVSVTARRTDSESPEAGPFSARIVDVSRHGACLLLTQVMMRSFHIFHSTRDDEAIDLVLHLTVPAGTDPVEVKARPVWLNSGKIDDIKVFRMGVDFVTPISADLLQRINKEIGPET
ncbi:MAG: hypothetical protein Kow0089_20210 [Desulfobulbaceae bacterium]